MTMTTQLEADCQLYYYDLCKPAGSHIILMPCINACTLNSTICDPLQSTSVTFKRGRDGDFVEIVNLFVLFYDEISSVRIVLVSCCGWPWVGYVCVVVCLCVVSGWVGAV